MATPLKVRALHLDSRLEVRQPSLEVSMLPLSHGAAPRGSMATPSRSELLYPSRSYGVALQCPCGTPRGPLAPPLEVLWRLPRGRRCITLRTAVNPGIYGLAFTMGKWFLTENSATVGRILMISSADPS